MNTIYNRLKDMSPFPNFCCSEQMFDCPDCGTPLCVFCMDSCEGCGESIF